MSKSTVYQVNDVSLKLTSDGQTLSITADGVASCPNCTEPHLEIVNYGTLPPDGIQDLLFCATPPILRGTQILSLISAPPFKMQVTEGLRGVRVNSATNNMVAVISEVPADSQGEISVAPTSKVIPFDTLLKSVQDGPQKPAEAVITSVEDYREFFKYNPKAVPTVDFTKEMVFAVAMGEQPTSGYSTEITSIVHMTAGYLAGLTIINYQEIEPTPDDLIQDVIIHPVHAVKCEQITSDQVIFNKQ